VAIDKNTPFGIALVEIAQQLADEHATFAVINLTSSNGYDIRVKITVVEVHPPQCDCDQVRLAEWDAATGMVQ
jgi:hypothetical protein